jgi:ribosomal protein S18 acetylase RimI-like enzyme
VPCLVSGQPSSFDAVWTRSWQQGNRGSIFDLLRFLPSYYPGADDWLERRLNEVERGQAACTIGGVGRTIGGVLIETPKGKRTAKISTLYVRSNFAGYGLGSRLLHRHRQKWIRDGIDCAYVTVASERMPAISGFLEAHSFNLTRRIWSRYRPNVAEYVFSLNCQ